jgi:hypothetical protein
MAKFNQTRTYGIEIEFSFGETRRGISASQMARLLTDGGVPTVDAGYSHSTMATWKIVTDGSVHNGFELVSPPMSGIESRETLRTALRIIKENGARTHRSCGIHVHQYVGDLTNAKQLANVVELYKSHEPIIDQFFAESRRNSRWCKSMNNGMNHYENAAALRTNVLPAIGITGRSVTASSIINAITNGDRYYKVNYMAYTRQATVEFRQHHSSLNINKLWSWIVFTQMIVETAAKHRGKIVGRIVRTGNQETAAVRGLVRELGMRKSRDYDEVTLNATKRLLKRLPSNITVHLRNGVAVNDDTDSAAVAVENLDERMARELAELAATSTGMNNRPEIRAAMEAANGGTDRQDCLSCGRIGGGRSHFGGMCERCISE